MKVQPETLEAMYHAGYRGPESNPLVCSKCPSVARSAAASSRFYCRRHGFYVHSLGYCPDHGKPLPGSAPLRSRRLGDRVPERGVSVLI